MMADTLFKIKAGKVISVQEGVLLATKGSNFSENLKFWHLSYLIQFLLNL